MSEVLRDVTSIVLAIIGLAVLAVFVSRNANTAGVLNSASSALNTGIATAAGPVSGYSPGPPIYAAQRGAWGEFGAGYNTTGFAA